MQLQLIYKANYTYVYDDYKFMNTDIQNYKGQYLIADIKKRKIEKEK